ncbi:hypothetical protein [Neorhizobium alkalisoli]|jgi:hypothetical protein|uniref:hypothetical protein n=1 Tax=Neorhizobium alkalisoli TaxID=528178 RepID=UPI0011A69CA0|nr:hypothetical protein [Neorhizobium alkalisoli]
MSNLSGMKSSRSYEPGMRIIHYPITETVVVGFRGETVILKPVPDRRTAIAAGEALCREKGWTDDLRQ